MVKDPRIKRSGTKDEDGNLQRHWKYPRTWWYTLCFRVWSKHLQAKCNGYKVQLPLNPDSVIPDRTITTGDSLPVTHIKAFFFFFDKTHIKAFHMIESNVTNSPNASHGH